MFVSRQYDALSRDEQISEAERGEGAMRGAKVPRAMWRSYMNATWRSYMNLHAIASTRLLLISRIVGRL